MQKFGEKDTKLNEFPGKAENIEVHKAIDTARRFLEQYNSAIVFRSANLEEKTWVIMMNVGLVPERVIRVRINSENGKILGYTQ
ncbi:MAG: hypothetical protein E6K98_00615 [Thaumarchaeota archaeon]|nr:MAG: hypothetical protein E6K98_00615 [Nitrososphaerota archaeon]TLX94599.1 MAG: hypothetical protein E6K91_05935 [Nitrososphaerota archaeon]